MKATFFLIFILFCTSCSLRQQQFNYYLSSGIENIEVFPANKKDSIKIDKIDITIYKSLEECKKNKSINCIDDRGIVTIYAEYPKGIYNFRTVLIDNFKPPKIAKIGENRIRVIIGTQDNLEKIEILKYTDKNIRKAIENVFKSKELNTWKSATIYGIPVKQKFEISIFIENKKIAQ